MQETGVQSLVQDDPLEKGIFSFHSSFLAWRIPWTKEPGGLCATLYGAAKNQTRLSN